MIIQHSTNVGQHKKTIVSDSFHTSAIIVPAWATERALRTKHKTLKTKTSKKYDFTAINSLELQLHCSQPILFGVAAIFLCKLTLNTRSSVIFQLRICLSFQAEIRELLV